MVHLNYNNDGIIPIFIYEDNGKLYYYENTHLFRCYTYCGDTFDIFENVLQNEIEDKKVKAIHNKYIFTDGE